MPFTNKNLIKEKYVTFQIPFQREILSATVTLQTHLNMHSTLIYYLHPYTLPNTHLSTDGFVILSCQEPVTSRASGQLLFDQLTDSVVSAQPSLKGEPYLTPDSETCVTVDRGSSVTTVAVQRLDSKW